ncbi:hypothetical protein BADSM9389_24440 [Buttiauxella agrestis]|nr:hypothetical protein BADSM9389_24440 [Buttiauxella agrestis]
MWASKLLSRYKTRVDPDHTFDKANDLSIRVKYIEDMTKEMIKEKLWRKLVRFVFYLK